MKIAEIEFLFSNEAKAALEAAHKADPAEQVLRWRTEHPSWPSAALATQLRLRQRAENKLPTWYESGAVFDALPLEQCTSEAVAKVKFESYTGKLAVDLTAGLGVDTWALCARFEEVIALELDPIRAELLTRNAQVLGLQNLHVVQADASEWLKLNPTVLPDLFYLDPARRAEDASRTVALHRLQPDPTHLLPTLLSRSPSVLMKLSPLFDSTVGRQQLPNLRSMTCISLEGECKEWFYKLSLSSVDELTMHALVLRKGQIWHYERPVQEEKAKRLLKPIQEGYLLEPDVALRLTDLEEMVLNEFIGDGWVPWGGWYLSENAVQNFPGRCLRIVAKMPFQRKDVLSVLKRLGITQANVAVRSADHLNVAKVRKILSLAEGGKNYLFVTAKDHHTELIHARYED
jgi:hypothetical protein